jgi:hypothetical protein
MHVRRVQQQSALMRWRWAAAMHVSGACMVHACEARPAALTRRRWPAAMRCHERCCVCRDICQRTALMHACAGGHIAVIQEFKAFLDSHKCSGGTLDLADFGANMCVPWAHASHSALMHAFFAGFRLPLPSRSPQCQPAVVPTSKHA